MNRALLRLGLVAAAVAILVGVAALVPPGQLSAGAPLRPTRVPLDQTTLACPESRYAAGTSATATTTDVGAIAAPSGETVGTVTPKGSRRLPPRLDIAALGTAAPLSSVDRRERLASFGVRKTKVPPIVVSAKGAVAPGVTAGQLTRSGTGTMRGLAESSCAVPGSEFWFVGAGSELGRHGRVYLTNIDDATARVDLQLYDEKGPIEDEGARGLTVPAHDQVVVELDKLAPTSKRLAVAVNSRRGRVVAALRDDALQGETPVGVDWIPSAAPPAKELLVPGVASGAGGRVLSIVAPGDATASVDLSILAPHGSFQPAKLGRLEVKPGAVAQVPLDQVTQKQAAAVRVSSDVPVTASVRNELGPSDGVRDVAYSAAARSLSGPAVVPVTLAGTGRSATLLLSTPARRAVRASAAMFAADGRPLESTKVVVKPGSTVEVKLAPPKGESRYVLVVRSDDGGPLYGTRLQVESPDDGPMVSSWPLVSGVTTAVRPLSRPDLGAGIGVEDAPGNPFG